MTEPEIDAKAVAENLFAMVPFTGKLNFVVEDVRPGYARIRLPYDAANTNHVGSMHAGAIFTLLETTAGMALITALGELGSRLLVTGAKISYARKVMGAGVAVADASPALLDQARRDIEQNGKALFTFAASLLDEQGVKCAECAFDYRIKPPSA